MYTNTSYELIRRALFHAGIEPTKVKALRDWPEHAETEYGAAIPKVGLVDLMDRIDTFAEDMRKINRIMVPRVYAYYDSKREAWIIRFSLRLLQNWEK